ncbi:hypothetical protein L6R53_02390 [Myxococcota bacterium]|nr:hypothetical protein [Myxococcota bacterium]
MPALAHQVILRLRDDRVIAPSVAARRALARAVAKAGQPFSLLVFRAADTHLHIVALCPAREAAELGRRAEIALVRALALPVGFNAAHVRPVNDQAHLRSLFFYVLGQERHHGTDLDPFHDASNLPDLLGMRLLAHHSLKTVRAALPRLRRADLLQPLGIDELPELPASWDLLAEAAAAAGGLPDLLGRSAEVVAARRAAVHAAREVLSGAETGRLLGVSDRAVTRLRGEEADKGLVQAVRRQLGVRAARPEAAVMGVYEGEVGWG